MVLTFVWHNGCTKWDRDLYVAACEKLLNVDCSTPPCRTYWYCGMQPVFAAKVRSQNILLGQLHRRQITYATVC